MTLREKLIAAGKTRWLDVGCGNEHLIQDGFLGIDTLPPNKIDKAHRKFYSQANIVKLTAKQRRLLGTFDLVRLQHVIEHVSFEDASVVLRNCARLLKPGGIILVSGPDLAIHVGHYRRGDYNRWWPELREWNENARIPKNSPNSFHFSMFSHNVPSDPHLWDYDHEGIEWQLKHAGSYKQIQRVPFKGPLASEPFTHNRPKMDFCVMAVKK